MTPHPFAEIEAPGAENSAAAPGERDGAPAAGVDVEGVGWGKEGNAVQRGPGAWVQFKCTCFILWGGCCAPFTHSMWAAHHAPMHTDEDLEEYALLMDVPAPASTTPEKKGAPDA